MSKINLPTFPFEAVVRQDELKTILLIDAKLGGVLVSGPRGGDVHAPAHHRASTEGTMVPISHARRQEHPAPGAAIYRSKAFTASFLHLLFPSNPIAVAKILNGEMINA